MPAFKTFVLACLLSFTASAAHAITIHNLTGEPYNLVIEQGGNTQTIVIPKGQRYERVGVGIVLHPEGRSPVRTHPQGEYAIWPDGKIHIQRYKKVQIGGN